MKGMRNINIINLKLDQGSLSNVIENMAKSLLKAENYHDQFGIKTTMKLGTGAAQTLGFYFESCVLNGVLQAAAADPNVIARGITVNNGISVKQAAMGAARNQLLAKRYTMASGQINTDLYRLQLEQAGQSAAVAGHHIWTSILKPEFEANIRNFVINNVNSGGSSSTGDLSFSVNGKQIVVECKFYTLNETNTGNFRNFTLSDSAGNFPRQFWQYLRSMPEFFWRVALPKPAHPLRDTPWYNAVTSTGFQGFIGESAGGSNPETILQFILGKGSKASKGVNARYIVSGGKIGQAGLTNPNKVNYQRLFGKGAGFTVVQSGLNVGITGNLVDPSYGMYSSVTMTTRNGSMTFYSGGMYIGNLSIESGSRSRIASNSIFRNYTPGGWPTTFESELSLSWIHGLGGYAGLGF